VHRVLHNDLLDSVGMGEPRKHERSVAVEAFTTLGDVRLVTNRVPIGVQVRAAVGVIHLVLRSSGAVR
jgi:hypothetical protein